MELFSTSSHYILLDGESALWCDRCSGKLLPKKGDSLLTAWNPVCIGIVHGVIGKIKLHPESDWRLLLVKQRELVGKLGGKGIYKIKKIAVLPLTTADPLQDIDLEPCTKHHFGMTKPERAVLMSDSSSSSIQKTLNSIKTAAESVKSKRKEKKDKEKFEKRIYEELLKMYNDSGFFYYSNTFDLTNSLQRQNQSTDTLTKPLWKRADERFFWNKHMLVDLIDDENELAKNWILPIIQGFVQIETCIMDFNEGRQSSPGATPEFNCTFHLEPLSYNICLISRRSRHRAGTRSRKRGIDETGACANYVETEQIIEFSPHLVSFVQVRGSVPVFWSQSGVKYRPPPRLTRGEDESHVAFLNHFGEQLQLFSHVVVVSLAELAGKEQVVGDAYLSHILRFNSPHITYVTFDFHEYCRGMRFENVSLLTDGIKDIIKNMRYCWVDNKGVICEQNGVFRINCIDCLDRTNVVQTAIARIVMETQFRKLGLLPPEESLPPSCRRTYQQLWANNGDAISQQYAGTAALKGDFTRTGERKLTGLVKDGMNSANRYYQRFRDAYRQAAIDLTLGQPVSDDLLAKPGETAEDEGGDDTPDGEEQLEGEENLRQLIEDCKRMLIVEPEQCLGGWGVINADTVTGDADRQEMDVILLLSQRSVYVAWHLLNFRLGTDLSPSVSRYDDEEEQIVRYQCIFLEDVEKLEIGAEPAVFKSRFLCLRIHYHHLAEDGFFHTFRTPNIRLFNNLAVAVKNQDDARESLRAIAQTFVAAQRILSIELPVLEKQKLDRRKSKPHPDVVDVHQQQQENSLASIHLPRDISTEVRSDQEASDGQGSQGSFHHTIHPSPQEGLNSVASYQHQQHSLPMISPQRAAASALGILSQLSARTSSKTLKLLKPSIRVSLSSFIPGRQSRQQELESISTERVIIPDSKIDHMPSPSIADKEMNKEPEEQGKQPEKAVRLLSSGSDDPTKMRRTVKVRLRSLDERLDDSLTAGEQTTDGTMEREVLVEFKKNWQEVNLESCGILATSPTQLLFSSVKWAAPEISLPMSLDEDTLSAVKTTDRYQFPNFESLSHSISEAQLTTLTPVPASSSNKGDIVGASGNLTRSKEMGKVKSTEQNVKEQLCIEWRINGSSESKGRAIGPKQKSCSAEDIPRIAVSERICDIEDETYCVLDEKDVQAILSNTDSHMKTSRSDNALQEEANSVTANQGEISTFSRLRLKMSSLTVPRPVSSKTPFTVSKSHIRKSQRAMEVFERLVREKLGNSECQSRIIFI